MSAYERTGWRDPWPGQWISDRHREWGSDCPMADIDFLGVEYDRGVPVCLIDWKDHHASVASFRCATDAALERLASGWQTPLPYMIVRYWPDTASFEVHPRNAAAMRHYGGTVSMNEADFAASLYRIRGRQIPFRVVDSRAIDLHDDDEIVWDEAA